MNSLIILGSGPAGLTAAIYAGRANLSPIVIHGNEPGGQLTITTDVENFPGFRSTTQGPDLIEEMTLQAENAGTTFIHDTIERVDFSKQPFELETSEGDIFHAKSVIIATGSQAKWLGLPSEMKFRGRGVSSCATCDGFFYKEKTVVVVGGGNTAVEEALYLTKHATKVIIIHRRDEFRAEKILQDRLFSNDKIEVVWNSVVTDILGDESVEGVLILNNDVTKAIPCDGVFIAIGHTPNTDLFKGQIELTTDGYIKTNNTKTNIKGVFACGDVQDNKYRQAITAAGTGCVAAIEAMEYLN